MKKLTKKQKEARRKRIWTTTKRYGKGAIKTAYVIKGGLDRWEEKMGGKPVEDEYKGKKLKKRLKNIRRIAY